MMFPVWLKYAVGAFFVGGLAACGGSNVGEPGGSASSSSSSSGSSSSSSSGGAVGDSNVGLSILGSDGQFEYDRGAFVVAISGAAQGEAKFEGEAHVNIGQVSSEDHHIQFRHRVNLEWNREYVVCYRAKAASQRTMRVNLDAGEDGDYKPVSDIQAKNVSLSTFYQAYAHPFRSAVYDRTARLTFNLGLSAADVYLDDVAIYTGSSCPATWPVGASAGSGSPRPWQPCASEGGECTFLGVREVRYTRGSQTRIKLFSDFARCSAAIFRVDPGSGSCESRLLGEGPRDDVLNDPHYGTVFIGPDIVMPSDPSAYLSSSYVGQQVRNFYDIRKVNDPDTPEDDRRIDLDAYVFNLQFEGGHSADVVVSFAVGSQAVADELARSVGKSLGQIPEFLRRGLKTVFVHEGDGRNSANTELMTLFAARFSRNTFEELLIHEATHSSVDRFYKDTYLWKRAQVLDQSFISTYARDNYYSEDMAESLLPWLATKLKADRIPAHIDRAFQSTLRHRNAFFDSLGFDLSPMTKTSQLVRAEMQQPQVMTTLPSDTVEFVWLAPDRGADAYQLQVGTRGVGSTNVADETMIAGNRVFITGLPTSYQTVYVRLWTVKDNTWRYEDYEYFAYDLNRVKAGLYAPAFDAPLASVAATFQWDRPVGASNFDLLIGTSGPGSTDVRSSNPISDAQLSITNLPVDGKVLYVRLWTFKDGAWDHRDYEYRQSNLTKLANLLSPAPGSRLTSTTTFKWDRPLGATSFDLQLGTTGPGSQDIRAGNQLLRTTEVTLEGLPTDKPVYLRFWTHVSGDWNHRDYVFNE